MPALPVSALRYAAFLRGTFAALEAAPVAPAGRFGALDLALDAAPPGLIVELGVWRGDSLRHLARRAPGRSLHGFDSQTGFPEDGRPDWQQDFRLPGAPRLPRTATLHVGEFGASLPRFAASLRQPIGLVNIDCDIHSSASIALLALAPHLRPGVVLHLDEALNYDTWLWNEMLALFELLEATGLGLRWIGRPARLRDLPATLAALEAGRYPAWDDDVAAGFGRQAVCVLTETPPDLPLAEAVAITARLTAASARHYARTQRRVDCDPLDLKAPPPSRGRARWRWLRP